MSLSAGFFALRITPQHFPGRASGVVAGTNSRAPGMTTSETSAEMLDAFARLIDLQNVPGEIAFMGALIEREIIFRVLQSAEGQRLRAIATLGDNSQRRAKAVEWIRDHFTEPLRMDEHAQVACMGVSTLHHHFRIVTSMTPLQYQNKLRLHEARRRMLTDGMDAATAGFDPESMNRIRVVSGPAVGIEGRSWKTQDS
jgi:AraC-like DNA-binding protein